MHTSRSEAARAAFTLMEVLAVIFLTALVLGVALDFYTDLSRATARAADSTRGLRRATAILDRVARDLESAVLVQKPAERDPLEHPWLFLAEQRHAAEGADHLKFTMRGHQPRRSGTHESDLATVAYTVHTSVDDSLELRRWSSPRLPEGLDRDFPHEDDTLLLAEGLAAFGVRLMNDTGEWVDEWDSSQLVESSELPVAVQIELALLDGERLEDGEPLAYRRTVVLPLKAIDMETLLDPSIGAGTGEDEEGDEEGENGEGADEVVLTVGECVIVSPDYHLKYFYDNARRKPFTGMYREWALNAGEAVQVRSECL